MYIPLNTRRAWASRVAEVSKRWDAYKQKGKPIGIKPDHMVAKAVVCVNFTEVSFSLTSRSLDILFRCFQCLALGSSSSWQLWSSRPDTLFSPDNLFYLFLMTLLSLDISTFFLAFLSFAAFFFETPFSRLSYSSLIYSLVFTFLLFRLPCSSLLYSSDLPSIRFSTFFTYLLSSLFYSLYFSHLNPPNSLSSLPYFQPHF